MKTWHKILFGNSNKLSEVNSGSVNLVITSPPYPMIKMWDEVFSEHNVEIKHALEKKDGRLAFNLMHTQLDEVWNEVYRILKNGGIACINIGDATRTINSNFQLYSNHSRILHHCLAIGFCNLPAIIWRKQTNAPNKFMGSGMLPAGAYVTLEHEFILILRKGGKRDFASKADAIRRRQSSFFWEERNKWFSDVWLDLKGATQGISDEKIRGRTAAYPFELAYRLINMFSCKRDVVLDPYAGTGTTTIAAMVSERNSIGIEIDPNFRDAIVSRVNSLLPSANSYILERIGRHLGFVKQRSEEKGALKYENRPHGFPVMTRQELDIVFNKLREVKKTDENCFEVLYSEISKQEFGSANLLSEIKRTNRSKSLRMQLNNSRHKQEDLFSQPKIQS